MLLEYATFLLQFYDTQLQDCYYIWLMLRYEISLSRSWESGTTPCCNRCIMLRDKILLLQMYDYRYYCCIPFKYIIWYKLKKHSNGIIIILKPANQEKHSTKAFVNKCYKYVLSVEEQHLISGWDKSELEGLSNALHNIPTNNIYSHCV